jgi:hypothetical protein
VKHVEKQLKGKKESSIRIGRIILPLILPRTLIHAEKVLMEIALLTGM